MKDALFLDLASVTGWATSTKPVASGTIDYKGGRFEGGGMRFLRFRDWLEGLAKVTTIKAVYFEEVRRHLGTDAAHVYGGLLAVVTLWCEERKIPYLGVPVGTIKKHATGKGNASKAAVIAAVKAMGYDPRDDNEADALALMHCVLDGAAT